MTTSRDKSSKGIYRKFIKRPIDFVLSLMAIIVLSPVLMVVVILIRFKLGSPVLFKQKRPGLHEKIFTVYKFRTMTDERDHNGDLLPDSFRLTRFGKLLRNTSLDELPELFNILKGDMSIIGPRPLSIFYLPHYNQEEKKRHNVRPGLTGLAQISGRNELQWSNRFKLDIEYVKNITFLNDFRILIGTVSKVFAGSNVAVRGTSNIKDFGVYRVLEEEGKQMKSKEIGSFFELEKRNMRLNGENNKNFMPAKWLPGHEKNSDNTYTFSGRLAIECAINDIIKSKTVKTVYMPSYICVSMLQPFLDKDMKVEFYDVIYENQKIQYEINLNKKCDIFFAMSSYFGFYDVTYDKIIQSFKDRQVPVIEDITHALLCAEPMSSYSDYCVASLRKWFAIPTGGYLLKLSGKIKNKPDLSGDAAVESRIKAMTRKYDYIVKGKGDKKEFLEINKKFDNSLIRLDSRLKIDSLSANILNETSIEHIIKKRRQNAQILYNGLKDVDIMQFLVPKPDWNRDTPLFVPILLENEKRNELRQHLINNGIYCPIHWPEVMGTKSGISKNELSLVCDQRYDKEDMLTIVEKIKEWVSS